MSILMRTRKFRKNKTMRRKPRHFRKTVKGGAGKESSKGRQARLGALKPYPQRGLHVDNKTQESKKIKQQNLIKKTINDSTKEIEIRLKIAPELSELFIPVSQSHIEETQKIEQKVKETTTIFLDDQIPHSLRLLRTNSNRSLRPRMRQGITSCRQLVVLIILSSYSEQLFTSHFPRIPGDDQIGTRRKLLSKIWRYTLQERELAHLELKNFFADNGTEMMARIILGKIDPTGILQGISVAAHTLGLEGSSSPFSFENGIYPMALTNCEGTHISHYFTVIIDNEEIYIYTAYGSDYLKAHPERIKLDLKEFNDFILAGISLCLVQEPEALYEHDALYETVRTFFTKYFTQNADEFVRYLDEGHTPARSIIITREKGIELEFEFYKSGFRVMYFPTVKDDLLAAAQDDIQGLGIEALIARVMS